MNIFRDLKHKIISNKFKRQGLGIIENISADEFQQIVDDHQNQGWEFYGAPNQFNWSKKWTVQLKKGISVLTLSWAPQTQGKLVGIKRILNDVAKQYNFKVLNRPTQN